MKKQLAGLQAAETDLTEAAGRALARVQVTYLPPPLSLIYILSKYLHTTPNLTHLYYPILSLSSLTNPALPSVTLSSLPLPY